ncbi:ABC transporter permease [Candidatus Saganbacteria bacterium]|nr:ABC transporter permease [Candidatus Saganbacteria bacterium]
MKLFGDIEFFVVEAFRGVRRSGVMSLVAIGIVTVSLFIFGLFLLFMVNLGNMVAEMGTRLDIVAYVEKAVTPDEAAAITEKLSHITGVEKVRYVSREEAWRSFRDDFTQKLDLATIVGENPLPDSFAIKVRTPDILPKVAEAVAQYPEVDEVRYSGKLIKQIQTLIDALRLGGMVLVVLLFFATLLIVVNTIRLTVLARETDIYIMKLVGATRSFIRWPFVIEGVLIGVLGGLFGILILKPSYDAVTNRLQVGLPFLPLMTDKFTLNVIYLVVGISGMLLGMLGGYISVSRLLKEK